MYSLASSRLFGLGSFMVVSSSSAIFAVMLFALCYVRGMMNCAALSMLYYNGEYSENAVLL